MVNVHTLLSKRLCWVRTVLMNIGAHLTQDRRGRWSCNSSGSEGWSLPQLPCTWNSQRRLSCPGIPVISLWFLTSVCRPSEKKREWCNSYCFKLNKNTHAGRLCRKKFLHSRLISFTWIIHEHHNSQVEVLQSNIG